MKRFFIISLIFSLVFVGLAINNPSFAASKNYKRVKNKPDENSSVEENTEENTDEDSSEGEESEDLFQGEEDIDGADNVTESGANGWQEAH